MAITVHIPTPLRPMTGNEASVECSGDTVGAVLGALAEQYPDVRERLFDADGNLRRFVNFFLNGDNIRDGQGADTAVQDGDELSIVPAIAGGSPLC